MFWVHGGPFIFGSGTTYDGSTLARKHKFIVVTINYRLGAPGFLAFAQLDAESRDPYRAITACSIGRLRSNG